MTLIWLFDWSLNLLLPLNMITRKITLVLLFVLFWAVQGNASIKYQFTFANDTNKNGKVFTSNGAHITVSDIDTYVEIQEITSGPNTRLKSGMIQLDFNNNVDFDTHLNFASWTYYIGMAIYINYNQSWMQSHF